MLEILNFTFSSVWHFCGVLILLTLLCQTLIGIASAISTKEIHHYINTENQEDDKSEDDDA